MKKRFLIILFIIILIFLVLNPEKNIDAFFMGIRVWATAVLPALFPFFFFTKFLAELNFPEMVGKYLSPITKKLYRTSGISGYVFVMSILSGYPVGAKLVCDMVEMKIINKEEASRIISFTSTSGPLFIIGTVGVGLFHCKTAGMIIFLSHILGAILNGLIYRNIGKTYSKQDYGIYKSLSNKNVLEECMFNSIKSILIIGGYVAIFFLLISIINNYKLLNPLINLLSLIFNNKEIISSTLNGIIEVTRGCLDLSIATNNINSLIILASLLIGFGGFSVHFQAYTFLKKIGISFKLYLLSKITHAVISAIIAYFIVLLI